MSEPMALDAFEAKLSEQVRSYTGAATARPFDPIEAARTAMASASVTGSAVHWSAAGPTRRWWLALIPIAAVMAGALAVGANVQRRTPEVVGEPVPTLLRHTWARPYAVTPGGDVYGSGFLAVTDRRIDYGREPGAEASTSSIAATGSAALEVVATAETRDCAVGDSGAYRWTLEGSDSVLTLTPISADACPARQAALAGPWVRSDYPPVPVEGSMLPGAHQTSKFDPLDNAAAPMRLAYTIPEGWRLVGDDVASFVLQRLPDSPTADPNAEPLIAVIASPAMSAGFAPGAACGPTPDEPGVGSGVDDLVGAIVARPGVVSTPPAPVTIAGHVGRLLDLRLAPGWTGGCADPSGPLVGVPILHAVGSPGGPVVGVGPGQPIRLILLDKGNGRTLAIVLAAPGDKRAADFEGHVAASMPIVETFAFVPASP